MTMSKLVLACVLAAAVGGAHANHARTLSSQFQFQGDFAAVPKWPYCRCDDYSGEGNPYNVTLSTTQYTEGATSFGEHCLTFSYNGPLADASECYGALEESLEKFQIAIQPACPPSWDVTGHYMSIDGVERNSGKELKTFSAQSIIKVSNLGLNKDTAPGTKICFRLSFPCDTAANFFDQLPVLYTVQESSYHKCCPSLNNPLFA